MEVLWIAIAYNPIKEKKEDSAWGELAGDRTINRPPIGRHFQIPPLIPAKPIPGQSYEARSIFLRPGTNLGVLLADWQAILAADDAKGKRGEIQSLALLIERGAIVAVAPEQYDLGEPGFRHFASKTAIELINLTTHEDWLAGWMEAEVRPEVIKAANEHRSRIIAAKKREAA